MHYPAHLDCARRSFGPAMSGPALWPRKRRREVSSLAPAEHCVSSGRSMRRDISDVVFRALRGLALDPPGLTQALPGSADRAERRRELLTDEAQTRNPLSGPRRMRERATQN